MPDSDYLESLILKSLPDLRRKGCRIVKISDSQLLLEDLEEWLAKDAYKLERNSKKKLLFDVYSSTNTQIGGVIVSISVTRNKWMMSFCTYFSIFSACVIFVFWILHMSSVDFHGVKIPVK